MLQRVEVRNFQSLHHVDLELGPLTVIVGPSSSGKSALTRAMRTLTSNARGNAFISHGERVCTITAHTERGTVTLKRGKAPNGKDDEYAIVPADPEAEKRTYTKLGGTVPPEVSEFVGIAPKDPLNYAGQFDRPYLLDDSGGEVARVLGALTNVSVIFEGARESNRRKLAANSTLRTRLEDLDTLKARIETYRPLKKQLAAIGRAEEHVTEARKLRKQADAIAEALETAAIAKIAIKRADETLSRPVPSEAGILAARERLRSFDRTMSEISTSQMDARAAITKLELLAEEHAELETEYTETLRAMAQCPTCGQSTKELEHAHV
jgi:exonuclease SbcC